MAKAIHWDDLELEHRLGAGQAGEVWRARLRHARNGFPENTPVAVKQYKSWVLEQPGQYERMIRELEVGRRINHPNLVQTITILRMPDGRPALIMPFYEGQTLEAYLQKHRDAGTFPPVPEALSIVGKLAGAICALHDNGAIHRDVKPANIQLTERGPILMDFGVVRSVDFPEQTTAREFLGTIRYADPDYLFHGRVSHETDLYGLAALGYELFTGNQFVSDESHWASLVVEKSSRSPRELTRDEFHDICARCNLREADFVRLVCRDMLQKTIDLRNLESAVARELWTGPFRYGKDGFQSGHGTAVFPEGSADVPVGCSDHSEKETAVEDVANHLKTMLSEDEYKRLIALLTENYANVEGFRLSPRTEGRHLTACPRHALVMGHNLDVFHNWVFWFPRAVRIAYRNGLLT